MINKDSIMCDFCKLEFNNHNRIPRILIECGHSICRACLLIFLISKNPILCEKDKTYILFEKKNINSFPINTEILDSLKNDEVKNINCEKDLKINKNKKQEKQNFDKKKKNTNFNFEKPAKNSPKNFEKKTRNSLNNKFQKKEIKNQSQKYIENNIYKKRSTSSQNTLKNNAKNIFMTQTQNSLKTKNIYKKKNLQKNNLLTNLYKNTSEISSSSEKSEISNNCIFHKKKLELFCINCKEKICYKCGLFGDHKNHEKKEENDFIEIIEKLSNNLLMNFERIKKKEDFIKNKILKKNFFKENFFLEKKKKIGDFYDEILLYVENEKKGRILEFEKQIEEIEKKFEDYLEDFLKTDFSVIRSWKKKVGIILKKYAEENNFLSAFCLLEKEKKLNLVENGNFFFEKLRSFPEKFGNIVTEEISKISFLKNFFFDFEFSKFEILKNSVNNEKKNFLNNNNRYFSLEKKSRKTHFKKLKNDFNLKTFNKNVIFNFESFGKKLIKNKESKDEEDLLKDINFEEIENLSKNSKNENENKIKKKSNFFSNKIIDSSFTLQRKENKNDTNSLKNFGKKNKLINRKRISSNNKIISNENSIYSTKNFLQKKNFKNFFQKNFQKNPLKTFQKNQKKNSQLNSINIPLKNSIINHLKISQKTSKINLQKNAQKTPKLISQKNSKLILQKNSKTNSQKNRQKTSTKYSRKKSIQITPFEKQQLNKMKEKVLKKLKNSKISSKIQFLKNNKLTNLDLSQSSIKDIHIEALGDFLKSASKLKILKLNGNKLTKDGIRNLCGFLECSNLKILYLNENALDLYCFNFLYDLVCRNFCLKKIYFSGNLIDSVTAEVVRERFFRKNVEVVF